MNSRVRSHWEHMDLEVKTSLSQACLLLPAPRKLELVILKIYLLQFFKSLGNFNTVTLYSQKSGSVNSRAVFPSCFYCFWLCATFSTNDIQVWGLTPGSLCSCWLLFFLFCWTLTSCWLCTLGSCLFRLPWGLQETAGDTDIPSAVWGPLTTVAHLFDVKTIGCSAFCSEWIRNRHYNESSQIKQLWR